MNENTELHIEGSQKLTDIFGYWPAFHDAEVIDLHLWRGNVNPENNCYIFPVLTMQVHLWELTQEVDSKGNLLMKHHTLATLRFYDIEDDIELYNFNQQNAIFELSIKHCKRSEGSSLYFNVKIVPSYGLGALFKCSRIEVMDCKPCNEDGEIL